MMGKFDSFGQGIDVQIDQLGTEMTLSDNVPTKLTVQSASQATTKFYTGRKHYFNCRAWKSNHCIWEVNLSRRNVKSWALILRMRIDALIQIVEFFSKNFNFKYFFIWVVIEVHGWLRFVRVISKRN